ncbi:AraC family transcriptional regulator [Mucilaginibacter sp. HMF5004]|uniref:helix-turn-helix domain-containing protein n=1 Tax=Mucilaginibacter rivuli TaxID=2857527 RepID=UPI001C605B7C|nr:AraC family transcriptional regulator [Mucilaginibacter rivuli]MBW4888753.1 AraC family transcriptional regulator [Mucilaginibacter rivuli]
MQQQDLYPKVYLYRRIVYAKLFIDEHFADKIDLDNIAGEAAFSKFHFIRLFNSVYNKTPHQYLSHLRIEKAKGLLKTNMAVADVCYAVGFESVSSFTGLFKRLTGSTPASYQLQQHQKLNAVANAPLRFIPNCFAEKNGWATNSNFEEAV